MAREGDAVDSHKAEGQTPAAPLPVVKQAPVKVAANVQALVEDAAESAKGAFGVFDPLPESECTQDSTKTPCYFVFAEIASHSAEPSPRGHP